MFEHKIKINFYDCDPAGILFYGRIFNICHAAYEGLIESFNLDTDYWNNDSYVVPIIHSEASYHRPLKYGNTASVEVTAGQVKGSSFELNYICKNEKGETCTKVKTVHVFVDKSSWKKKEMPAEMKLKLEQLLQ